MCHNYDMHCIWCMITFIQISDGYLKTPKMQKIKNYTIQIDKLKEQCLTLNAMIIDLHKTLSEIETDTTTPIFYKNKNKITTTHDTTIQGVSIQKELFFFLQHLYEKTPDTKIHSIYKLFLQYFKDKYNIQINQQQLTTQRLGRLILTIDTIPLPFTIQKRRGYSGSCVILQTKPTITPQ